MKIANCIALGIWIFELFYGISKCVSGESIHPVIFMMAALCCILHYIGEIAREV